MADTYSLDTVHNFGIYTKSGKRTIFQIDYSCKCINLIERGNIKKHYRFEHISHYDSEDNLHLVIRFHGSKALEFDADTAEEKYTICHLLGIILGDGNIRPDLTGRREQEQNDSTYIRAKRTNSKQVIKEGILEKKGNTKIPTWSRRKLQVCPGEFSYYKPGEDVALNLVQLWENATSLSRSGQHGFTVGVKDRNYQFRVVPDKGTPGVDTERDKWIEAFEQAAQRKRATFLLIEMSKSRDYNYQNGHLGLSLPPIPLDDDMTFTGPGTHTSAGGSSSSGDSFILNLSEEFEKSSATAAINELDDVIKDVTQREKKPGLDDTLRNIALSAVVNTSPYLDSPTRNRARPPALSSNRRHQAENAEAENEFVPEPDYSPPPSPSAKANSPFDRDVQVSGKYTRVIGVSPSNSTEKLRQSGEYVTVIKPAGAVDVMPKFDEIPKLKKVGSVAKDEHTKTIIDIKAESDIKSNVGENVTVKQIQEQFEKQDKDKLPSPRELRPGPARERFPAPAPSAPKAAPAPSPHRHAPSPPVSPVPPPPLPCNPRPPKITAPPPPMSPVPPPPMSPIPPPPMFPVPPPPMPSVNLQRGRLKQVHWNRVPRTLVHNSIWERPHDMTKLLDVKLLAEQFSLKERDIPPQGAKAGGNKPQLLIEAKRAQNLGIFMSGLKNDGVRKLVDVLNCIVEDDSFPSEKLSTIRRYQPTQDEKDMYREYVHKKHELHPVDQFMLELCQIPCLSIRIDICLTIWDFPWQYDGTCQLIDQVHGVCDELLNSQMLVLVLEYLLAIGNYMNTNWSSANATLGFQISSIEKIMDVRGKESGYTLVHFLVEQLKTTDPGLLRWPDTVQTVKKCEQVSVKAVAAEIEVLKGDLTKAKRHLKTLKSKMGNMTMHDNKFQQDAQNLTIEYEMKLEKLSRRCGELHNKYRKLLTRFGEPVNQRNDNLFAVVALFSDRFKAAVKDIEGKTLERKSSTS